MTNLADLRRQYPSLQGMDDESAVRAIHSAFYSDFDVNEIAGDLGVKLAPPAAPVAPARGAIRGMGDLGIEAVSGLARGVKFTADAFGADNAVSRGAGSVDEFVREYLSAEAKQDDRRIAEIMAAAEDAGVWEQVKAGAHAFAQAPFRMAVNAVGTSVLPIAATMIPGVGQAGAAARLGMLGGMGAVQGAGIGKGSIYERVLSEHLASGMPQEQAEAAATKAQEYGGVNTQEIAGNAILGSAAMSTGAQPIFARALQGKAAAQAAQKAAAAKAAERGVLARAARGIATETPFEAAQGGYEQYAGNVALQREGFDVPTWRGVAGSATLEGLAAAPVGGVAGAMDRLGEAKTVEDMVKAANDLAMAPLTTAPPAEFDADGVEIPPGMKPRERNRSVMDEIRALDPAEQQEALGLLATERNPNASPSVRRYAMNRLEELLLPVRQVPAGEVIEDEALPTGETQELTASEAFGQIAIPPERGQMLKPGQRIPRAQATELSVDEIELGQLPVGEAIEIGGERPEGMAERTGSREGQVLSLSGRAAVMQYVNRLRNTNTPAARAFVQDFEAGRITPADVMDLIAPNRQAEPTPDERLAAAAAQAPTIQPGDLLTADGMPYGTRAGAAVRATREGGGDVVQVPGGYVVRTEKAPDAPDAAGDGIARPADAQRGDGGEQLRQQRPGDVAVDAGAADVEGVGGMGAAGLRPAGDTAPDDALSDDLPTLKKAWAEAVRANDRTLARTISDRINEVKARAAAPVPAVPAVPQGTDATQVGGVPDLTGGMFLVVGGTRYPVNSFREASEMARTAADVAKKKNGIGVFIGNLPIEDAQGRVIAHRGVADKIIVGPPVRDGDPPRSKVLYDPMDAIRADIKAKNEARTIDAEPVAKRLPAPAPTTPPKARVDAKRKPESKPQPVVTPTESAPEANAEQEAAAREPFEHAGLKVYPGRVHVGDKIENRWAVQLPENKATGKVLGDTLHATREGAMKAAEREAARFEREQRNRAERDAAEAARKAEEESRKAGNRGKSIKERAAAAQLDKPTKLPPQAGLGRGTRRESMDNAVEQGRAVVEVQVQDLAAKKRDQDVIDAVRRAGYILGASNENLPVVKAGLEARDRLKTNKYEKPEYRVYDGSKQDGPFYVITKTEYDYAQQRKATQQSEPAIPAVRAENLQERPEKQADIAPTTPKTALPAAASATTPSLTERVNARKKAGKPVEVATHKDPGEPAEPVTPAVVAEAIKTGVQATDRKPSAMKAELLAKVDAALEKAKADDDMDVKMYELATADKLTDAEQAEYKAFGPGKKRDDWMKRLTQGKAQLEETALKNIGHVTLKVPGDGAFKVLNSKPALREFRKKVEASHGFKATTPAPKQPRTNKSEYFGVERGSGGPETAIRNMIDEADPQAAVDYAAARGLDIADVLKGDKVRLPKIAGLTPTTEDGPVGEFAPEVPADSQREPWQMTQAEYADLLMSRLSESERDTVAAIDSLIAAAKKAGTPNIVTERQVASAAEKFRVFESDLKRHDTVFGVVADIGGGKYSVNRRNPAVFMAHDAKVKAAIAEGKPVPAAVLADYPKLKPATAPETFNMARDGITGRELPWSEVQGGSDAFQYALGRVEEDGAEAIYRRRASDRGTYGGWRWERDAPKAAQPAAPVAPQEAADEDMRGYAWALVKDGKVVRSGSLPSPKFAPESEDTKLSYYKAMADKAGADLHIGGYPGAAAWEPQEGLIFGMTWDELSARQQKGGRAGSAPEGKMPKNAVLAYSPAAPQEAEPAAPHRYALVNRPPSMGALPRGLEFTVEPRPAAGQPHHDLSRHGVLVTQRPLTDAELKAFELAPLVEGPALDELAGKVADDMADYAAQYAEQATEDPDAFARAVSERVKRLGDGVQYSVGDSAALADAVVTRLRDMSRKPAAPPAEKKPQAQLPALPVTAYRLERRYANGAVVRPLPGKTFTPEEQASIADWFKAAGWDVSTRAPSGISGLNNAGMTIDDIPEPYTAAQRKRDEAASAAAAKAAAKKAEQSAYLGSSPAGAFVADKFGDTLNSFNATAMAKFLDGTEPAFTGLLSSRAADALESMGIAAEGRATKDILADIKRQYEAAQSAPPAAAQEAKPGKIEDFGQKLEGARKDYAAALKDAESVDTATAPLSESWPEPDYQKMLAGGAEPYMVAFVHAARDELPTKPQKAWKLKGWVQQVELLRGLSQRLLSGEISRERVQSLLVKDAFGTLRKSVGSRAELYELVGHGRSLKGVTFAENYYSLYKGQENVRKWVVEQKAKATMFSNWPRELAVGDTKAEMLENFKAKLGTLDAGAKAKGQPQFVVYRKRGQEGAFIGKKIGREYVDLHRAADVTAARKYMQENAADLEKALEAYRQTPFERKTENQPRVGDDHRNGAPVTPEVFSETFGFRGVQFGNYVEQGRRQSDLNQAFDGLMDMAAVLGIPPRAISLNGKLGLAFGARGKGGTNAPAAHYEPGNVVINLTKGSGPGSLAHEWWHSLDNYFGKEGGSGGYGTGGVLGDKTRAEMKAAFNAVKAATQAKTLRQRAAELDKRKSKPYWDTPIELSARSFEMYVIAKLQDQGAANDYLANVVSKEFWDAQEAMRAGILTETKPSPTFPYPIGDEMPAVRAAFDEFFKTVETRTDDAGNVAMYSRAVGRLAKAVDLYRTSYPREDAGRPNTYIGHLARLAAMEPAIDLYEAPASDIAQRLVDAYKRGDTMPFVLNDEVRAALSETVGATTAADLRAAVAAELGEPYTKALEDAGLLYIANVPLPGMPRNAAGVTRQGEIGLFAANTPAGSTAVLYHEALHATLRESIGDAAYTALMERMGKLAAMHKPFFAEAAERIPADTAAWARDEELAAYAVEAVQRNRENIPAGVRKWVADFIAALKAGIAKALQAANIGLALRVRLLSDAAVLRKIALDGLRAMAVRRDAGADTQEAFSRALPTDTAAFRKWFGDSVVTENGKAGGKPLVVYHGTTGDFSEFDVMKMGDGAGHSTSFAGFFFSADANIAGDFPEVRWTGWPLKRAVVPGQSVMPVYLSIQNPLELTAKEFMEQWVRKAGNGLELQAAAVKAGHDGIRIIGDKALAERMGGDEYGADAWVAFAPEQIKSATGNRGTFDPADPDIRYSIASPEGIQRSLRENLPPKFVDWVQDGTSSQRQFNRWGHRTVSTQLHKAKINKEFGKVFYAVQDFMRDVSRIATHASDLAPDMLVTVDDLAGLRKIAPTLVSPRAMKKRKADLKAASDALFDGTSRYMRDEDGNPVPVPDDLRTEAGLVWTDAELQARGVSPEAIKMYRQARESIGQSLDSLLAADIFKRLSTLDPELIAENPAEHDAMIASMRRAVSSETPGKAIDAAMQAFEDGVARMDAKLEGQPNQHTEGLTERRKLVADVMADAQAMVSRVNALKQNGYAPLMRFGPYVVDILTPDGGRVGFRFYETQIAANRAAREMREQGYQVNQSIRSEQEYKMLDGLSPDVAMMFADMLGVDKNTALQTYLQNALAEQSALKRRIRRKNVEGFNEDGQRVLAAFITSNARAASRGLHSTAIQNEVDNIQAGDVKDEAIALANYVNDPKEEAQAVRSLLFVNYIGGSVASALVNLTQTFVQTYPFLAQYGGAVKAAARVTDAMRLALTKVTDPDLARAIKQAEDDGTIKPQEIFQLQAEASRSLGSNLYARTALSAWGAMFQAAEVFNRRTAFIAAYQTAKAEGMKNPMAFAEDAVNQTQGIFNKGNRPNWARGAVGATIFTFKTFTIQYVEFLVRLSKAGPEGKKAAALALGMLVVLAGVRGLPFAGDAEDLLDTVAQALGYNFTTRAAMNDWAVKMLGEDLAEVAQYGFSGFAGMPFDVSQRLGMHDLLPGTGILKKSETRKEDQVLEAFGVAGSFVRDALRGEARPIAIRNLDKAIDIANTGMYRDTRGRKVIDADGFDAFMKAMGLQPGNVGRESRAISSQYELQTLFRVVKGEISEQLALGRFEGDAEKVTAAREALERWNEQNPEARIQINNAAILRRVLEMRRDRRDRFLRASPREIRQTLAESL
jgi:hypothetical protein